MTQQIENDLGTSAPQGCHAPADRLALLAEMSASIVHEISQPLATIAIDAHTGRRWLQRETPDVERALGTIKRITEAVDRVVRIVHQVRALAGEAEPEMALVDLNEVVVEGLALVGPDAHDHRIPLRPMLEPGLPPVRGNRTQLQQVIVNLVLNGLQATSAVRDRSAVVVRTRRQDDGRLSLAVEDVGVGVDPESLDHLFNPFYSTKPQGSGMGLSICRAIVDVHGGQLRAARNAGPGMTFEVTIPAAPQMA
jgi:C4-dicarboxylate-specific signal transduction histidine kinase